MRASARYWELTLTVPSGAAEGLTNFLWESCALGVVEEERPGEAPDRCDVRHLTPNEPLHGPRDRPCACELEGNAGEAVEGGLHTPGGPEVSREPLHEPRRVRLETVDP